MVLTVESASRASSRSIGAEVIPQQFEDFFRRCYRLCAHVPGSPYEVVYLVRRKMPQYA